MKNLVAESLKDHISGPRKYLNEGDAEAAILSSIVANGIDKIMSREGLSALIKALVKKGDDKSKRVAIQLQKMVKPKANESFIKENLSPEALGMIIAIPTLIGGVGLAMLVDKLKKSKSKGAQKLANIIASAAEGGMKGENPENK